MIGGVETQGGSPEQEYLPTEQVISLSRELTVEFLADPQADRAELVAKLQQSLEEISPNSLIRDARQSYALAIAFCDLARQDEQYEEFFWDAYEALEYDQALIDALSQDERRIYEKKIERIKSGDAL